MAVRRRLLGDDSTADPTDPTAQVASYLPQGTVTPTQTPTAPASFGPMFNNERDDRRQGPEDGGAPGSPANTPPPPPGAQSQAPPAAPHTYNPMAGWDPTKLNDPNKHNTKYDFGRATQDYGGAWGRGNLQGLLDFYNSTYGGHAKVNGEDSVDFGENYGPVDILNGNGDYTQWLTNDPGARGAGGGPGAPGGPGGGPGDVGNDPFSQLIQSKLEELIRNNGRVGPDQEALQLENVRGAADRARKAEYSGAMSQLAARGALPEGAPGGQGGLALDALGNIERNDIAPNFAAAVRDYQIHNADLANSNLMGALEQGTNRQGMLSNIALQTLAQSTQFQEFLAQFGLDRDRTLYELQNNQNSAIQQLLLLWLHGGSISAGGHV